MAGNSYSTVQDIIDRVSQDLRLQLSSQQGAAAQPILIDYTDRISKQMLRFSRWQFLKSEPQYMMTAFGQTDYWLGKTADLPAGMVDSGLELIDVDRIQKDSVRDISNARVLYGLGANPTGNQFNFKSGQFRLGRPSNFQQDHNDPNILHIYPGPDNASTYRPVPNPPICSTVLGGALPSRSYFVVLTFVDTAGNESSGSQISISRFIPAGSLLTVEAPTLPFNETSTGVFYNQYNVYIGATEGSEVKQPGGPLNLGVNFVEPALGVTLTGTSVPQTNSLTPMGGYIIQFRYFKSRVTLTDVGQEIQIPDDYRDVVINGVSALGWKILSRWDDAQACQAMYKAGLTEMVWDKNLFPDTSFIRPDPGSYVNQQNLGILPIENI